MPSSTYQREHTFALEAVREAARLCRDVQSRLASDALEKRDRSPVTVADFGSQALVCRTLRSAFPDDPIIAEEDASVLRQAEHEAVLAQMVDHVRVRRPEADAETACAWIDHGNAAAYSDRFWTLDPIDGTKGFLRGDQYAVALALVVEGELQVGMLACPNLAVPGTGERGAVFAAVRGEGAYRYGLEDGAEPVPVRVSRTREVREARFCESVEASHSAHDEAAAVAERLGITAAPVRIDSQVKYAVVARGEADIYMRFPTRPGYVERIWDHAAGALVIAEAGGRVTDVAGRPLSFRQGTGLDENRGILATNGYLHDEVLAAIEAAGVV